MLSQTCYSAAWNHGKHHVHCDIHVTHKSSHWNWTDLPAITTSARYPTALVPTCKTGLSCLCLNFFPLRASHRDSIQSPTEPQIPSLLNHVHFGISSQLSITGYHLQQVPLQVAAAEDILEKFTPSIHWLERTMHLARSLMGFKTHYLPLLLKITADIEPNLKKIAAISEDSLVVILKVYTHFRAVVAFSVQ